MDEAYAMPKNPDAERAVLSCAVQWPGCMDQIAANPFAESLFFVPAHRTIWGAMLALKSKGIAADLTTLTSRLRETGELEHVGGAVTVAEIYQDAPTPKLLPDYLHLATESAKRRSLLTDLFAVTKDCFNPEVPIDATTQRLDTAIQRLLRSASSGQSCNRFQKVLADTIHLIEERRALGGKLPGISTGWDKLDEQTNGYKVGEMWVIGARPGTGKTAVALNLAENLARANVPTAFFSAEMFADELGIRSLSGQSKIDSLKLARGQVNQGDFGKIAQAVQQSMNWPLWIDDRPNMRLIDIQVGIRSLVREHGIKVAFVDYLQLIEEPDGSRSREDAVRRLSNALKQLAKELGITIVVLAQLNRSSEKRNDRRPINADLRDSGSIEQDANVIILLHAEEPDPNEAIQSVDLLVSKCRGGILGPIPFEFHKAITTFKPKAA